MRYLLILLTAFLVACGSALPSVKPYKMDIQQGNVVTSKMLLQLHPGMNKSQVRFILGSPLVLDSFHQNRWDYFYQMRQAGKVVEQRRVILDFDAEGKLARVRGDVVPQGSPEAQVAETNTNKVVEVAPVKREEKGVLDSLKFWKDDKAEAKKAEPQKAESEPGLLDKLKFWKSDTPKTDAKTEAKPETKPAESQQSAPEMAKEAPAADVPSVLAVPSPSLPEAPSAPSVVEPVVVSPAPVAPPADPVPPAPEPEPVKTQPIKTEPAPAPVPVKPASAIKPVASTPPGKQNEKLIFRMDKTLRPENLQAPAPEPMVEPVKKAPAPPPPPLPAEGEAGYFEKLLEKIGF